MVHEKFETKTEFREKFKSMTEKKIKAITCLPCNRSRKEVKEFYKEERFIVVEEEIFKVS